MKKLKAKAVERDRPSIWQLTNLTKYGNWRTIQASEAVLMASTQVNLYEAKTQLSSLVERAAKGEEFVIAKAGKPMAKLSAIAVEDKAPEPLPFGQNLLGLPKLPESFYEDVPLEYFLGDDEDPLREVLR
jgi:antitoxin (DNA-binding transcriptional repressor) of toxin-antitoxin stability system